MMRLYRIKTIIWKDLRDAIRDTRVLIALILPLPRRAANVLFVHCFQLL